MISFLKKMISRNHYKKCKSIKDFFTQQLKFSLFFCSPFNNLIKRQVFLNKLIGKMPKTLSFFKIFTEHQYYTYYNRKNSNKYVQHLNASFRNFVMTTITIQKCHVAYIYLLLKYLKFLWRVEISKPWKGDREYDIKFC